MAGASLRNSSLIRTKAQSANFQNAVFTGACLEDFSFNEQTNFEGLECDYFYFKSNQQERRPRSGRFKPGEFVALLFKSLETVDLIFADGIDWHAFFLTFQDLRSQYGDENLNIQAIEKKGSEAFVIRLENSPDANKVVQLADRFGFADEFQLPPAPTSQPLKG